MSSELVLSVGEFRERSGGVLGVMDAVRTQRPSWCLYKERGRRKHKDNDKLRREDVPPSVKLGGESAVGGREWDEHLDILLLSVQRKKEKSNRGPIINRGARTYFLSVTLEGGEKAS